MGFDKDIGALDEFMYPLGFGLEYISTSTHKLHQHFNPRFRLVLLVLNVSKI